MFKPCALIPVYNHATKIADIVGELRSMQLPVVLIDDGSDADCSEVLQQLSDADDQVHLHRLLQNRGKGGAVKMGLMYAHCLGFSHALQIDADGQHDISETDHFLSLARRKPKCLIAGKPEFDSSIPRVRFYCRYLTHALVWLNTLSMDIEDSMCGFRVYPLQQSVYLLQTQHMGERMDFDIEFIVRWYWSEAHLQQLPVAVNYPKDGISHFRGLEDNWLIAKLHARLFCGMLLRAPKLLNRRITNLHDPSLS